MDEQVRRGARLFGLSTTRLESGEGQTDPEAIAQILNSPLQLIGTSDAKDDIQTLAKGAPGDRLTREAEAALKRLQR